MSLEWGWELSVRVFGIFPHGRVMSCTGGGMESSPAEGCGENMRIPQQMGEGWVEKVCGSNLEWIGRTGWGQRVEMPLKRRMVPKMKMATAAMRLMMTRILKLNLSPKCATSLDRQYQ